MKPLSKEAMEHLRDCLVDEEKHERAIVGDSSAGVHAAQLLREIICHIEHHSKTKAEGRVIEGALQACRKGHFNSYGPLKDACQAVEAERAKHELIAK